MNPGVLKGRYFSNAAVDPHGFDKSSIKLPDNDFGLFVRVKEPGSSYLIATNPEFHGLGEQIGSSYLLDQLGFSPEQHIKLLGDALYETRLIRDSVFAQTGQRFLNRSISSGSLLPSASSRA